MQRDEHRQDDERVLERARAPRVAPVRAFLYCKGPAGCDPADVAAVRALERVASVEAIPLPNVGRCDHAYATHAVRRRDDLADATLFLKDTTPWHVHLGSMVNVLGLARARGLEEGLAGHRHGRLWRVRLPLSCVAR